MTDSEHLEQNIIMEQEDQPLELEQILDQEIEAEVPVEEHEETSDKNSAHSQLLEDYTKRFAELKQPEEKLQIATTFMRNCLSQTGTPYFKGFWEARQNCLALFKENLSPQVRQELWNEYRQLCDECHRLKQLLEEQSAFAIEQIDLAIQAVEFEAENRTDCLVKVPTLIFPAESQILACHEDHYQMLQRELTLLNAEAARINALRKELIKTEMRIRQKNKFFRRLSAVGDKIFPRRKELIKELSQLFLDDVEGFITDHFACTQLKAPLFYYREEIKALQSIAKILTLNTHSFTHTRTKLSECWDKVKDLDKERKKFRAEQRIVYQKNFTEIEQVVDALASKIANAEISDVEANQEIDALSNQIYRAELGRDEKKDLRTKLTDAKAPIVAKQRAEEELRLQKEEAVNREKKERVQHLKDRIQALIDNAEKLSIDEINLEKETIASDIQKAPLIKAEKMSFERLLKPIKDIINDKKEQHLLSLPKSDLASLEQLKQLLQQRKDRRKEVMGHLQELRKASGSSGLNFEKAIAYDEMLKAERERLEKIDTGIEEIEEKIASLEI
ncbi:MAG: hypothetical protein JHC93_03870 [Parachlamydiales bacterium]|nr:hypothetical protein [Parachlamydiales bacterium]